MKKVFAIVFAVILLTVMAPSALAADTTVYVSISVDEKLEVAAQPVVVSDPTVESAIKAAHAQYYSGGENGYAAGNDPFWNMFMITKVWGINATPNIIVNDTLIGADMTNPTTANTHKVKNGDNIIVSVSRSPMVPAKTISLTVSVSNETAEVTATSWTFDFMTFTYSTEPLVDATVIDPTTGKSFGTTDSNGSIAVPSIGVVAIDGLAAIPVDGSSASNSSVTTASNSNTTGGRTFGGYTFGGDTLGGGAFGGNTFGGGTFGGNTFGGDIWGNGAPETVSQEESTFLTYMVIGALTLIPIIFASCIHLLKRVYIKGDKVVAVEMSMMGNTFLKK